MQGAIGVDLPGERQLHQDAVNLGVGIEPFQQPHEVRLARVLGQLDRLVIEARFVAGFPLHPHVDLRGGIVAHEHHGEARGDTLFLELRDLAA